MFVFYGETAAATQLGPSAITYINFPDDVFLLSEKHKVQTVQAQNFFCGR